ncbi:MAG: helix-turn-helix transcriptional regulator [Bacilli bacterium]|nr:helix-turn-helix transcriptional regulator [Bacilli bacterium]
MNKKRVGNFIKQLRKEKGYSQEQLSSKLYDMDVVVSPNAISQWERGETVPDVSNLLTLANLFNASVDELLDGERYEKVDYKKLYFSYNNEWSYKYPVNTDVNLYEMNQNQKILIKNRFNELLRIRVENDFTKIDKKR